MVTDSEEDLCYGKNNTQLKTPNDSVYWEMEIFGEGSGWNVGVMFLSIYFSVL